jgi:hypothetical protein
VNPEKIFKKVKYGKKNVLLETTVDVDDNDWFFILSFSKLSIVDI